MPATEQAPVMGPYPFLWRAATAFFARILLNMPDLICLDESTSHLGDMTAIDLISTIRSELPQSIIMVVSHQKAVIDSQDMKYYIEKTLFKQMLIFYFEKRWAI